MPLRVLQGARNRISMHHYCILYTWTHYLLDKNFTKPSYLGRKSSWKMFCQCGKGCYILYAIFNTRQKIIVIRILPMRADGKIGKKFLLAKFLCMWYIYCNKLLLCNIQTMAQCLLSHNWYALSFESGTYTSINHYKPWYTLLYSHLMYKIDDMCRAKLMQLNTRPSLRLQVLETNIPTYMQYSSVQQDAQ